MGNFHTQTDVKCRKPHVCEQCGSPISSGIKASLGKGRYDGFWYADYIHRECQDAAESYAQRFDLWGEEWPWFQHGDFCIDDMRWMTANHPIVADRLGWSEKVAALDAEQDPPRSPSE